VPIGKKKTQTDCWVKGGAQERADPKEAKSILMGPSGPQRRKTKGKAGKARSLSARGKKREGRVSHPFLSLRPQGTKQDRQKKKRKEGVEFSQSLLFVWRAKKGGGDSILAIGRRDFRRMEKRAHLCSNGREGRKVKPKRGVNGGDGLTSHFLEKGKK